MIRKALFIGGCPRSGTSLLQAIFNSHNRCCSPPETLFLRDYVLNPSDSFRKNYKDREFLIETFNNNSKLNRLGIPAEEIIEKSEYESGGYIKPLNIYKRYLEVYVQREKKDILVEGTPSNILHLYQIKKIYPDSYILHLIRDPRDTILSLLKAEFSSKFSSDIYDYAYLYKISYLKGTQVASKKFKDRYFKVLYEDVLTNTKDELIRICKLAGIKFEEQMLEYTENASDVYSKEEEQWKGNVKKDILKNNFNKWKKEMQKEDVILIELICNKIFKSLPYKKSKYFNDISLLRYIELMLSAKYRIFKIRYRKLRKKIVSYLADR